MRKKPTRTNGKNSTKRARSKAVAKATRPRPTKENGRTKRTHKTRTQKPLSKVPVSHARRSVPQNTGAKSRRLAKAKTSATKSRSISTRPLRKKGTIRKGVIQAKVLSKSNSTSVKSGFEIVESIKDRTQTIVFGKKGNFESKLKSVLNAPPSYLKKFVELNTAENPISKVPPVMGFKNPQAVLVTIVTKWKGKLYYRNKISPPDMVINEKNTKKFVLERLSEYQDSWFESQGKAEEDETPLGSMEAFNADKIISVQIKYIY